MVLVYENHLIPSPFSGCGPIAAQLDPWCSQETAAGQVVGGLHVTLSSWLVGAVLGDSDVSTSAAWSTGHSAIHPLVTWDRVHFTSGGSVCFHVSG